MNIIKLQGFEERSKGIYYEYDADSTPLGEGAMGRVFKGVKICTSDSTREPVAIKVIFDNIPSRVIERARREASVRIDSPYLLKMMGFIDQPFISTINGQKCQIIRYFIVMELLSGITLYDMISGNINPQEKPEFSSISNICNLFHTNRCLAIQKIMIKVLRGVIALHEANFIHRDIDPSNIMITVDGHIKLIDFGICKAINSLNTLDQNLTSTGVFMGKVNYAAPELVIGDVAHQDPTTDIYALGILLFQLCTGHLPFSGDDNDVLLSQMRKKLPLSEIKNRKFRAIVAKATEKSQSQRYENGKCMLNDIEDIDFRKKDWKQITIISSIVFIIGILGLVTGLFVYKSEPQNNDNVEEFVINDKNEVKFKSIQNRLFSKDEDIVKHAFEELILLAEEERYPDAMFEYGLSYSRGNANFDIPTKRQSVIPALYEDVDRANLWLRRSLEKDNSNYRAVYWIINNMIDKKEKDYSSVLAEEISDLLHLFNSLTSNKTDKVTSKYKNALREEYITLEKWGIDIYN